MRIIENCWIALENGRHLAAKLWLPASLTPVPAILEYLPYRKRDGTAPRDASTYEVFARHGYAGVRVDITGSGESDGLFDDEYSERELAEGEEVLRWIAAQEWCDGTVGMIGISWGGFNGLQLAYRRPPELKAVVSACSTVDRYADDIHYMGGCLLTDNFNWGAQMTAYMTRPPDPLLREDWRSRWLERIEELPFFAAEWLRHPNKDDYWKHGSVSEDWSAIEVPVLAIGGWADAYLNAPGALAAYQTGAPVKALIGPWEHKYPHIARINPADFHGEVLRWFDRWLKGETNGAEELPSVRAFLQDHDAPSPDYKPRAGRWIAEAEWPSPDIESVDLYPAMDGRLTEDPVEGDVTVATPAHLGFAAAAYFCPGMRVGNELAGDQAIEDSLCCCFETLPIPEPLELLGRPELEICFSVDRPVAQICARLCDVASDGSSQRISYRPFNLCHYRSHETPEALRPGARYNMRFRLNMCGHSLAEGHRLRLALSTGYWPVVWPTPEAATVTLHLEGCRLILPRRKGVVEIEPQAPPPPRDFPKLAKEALEPPNTHTDRRVEPDGTHVLETEDDFGRGRHPDHGLIDASRVAQRFSIHPDDPLSARHDSRWCFEFARGDWSVRIDSESVMTCDAESFHLSRQVTAREGDDIVHEKRWEECIPRGLL